MILLVSVLISLLCATSTLMYLFWLEKERHKNYFGSWYEKYCGAKRNLEDLELEKAVRKLQIKVLSKYSSRLAEQVSTLEDENKALVLAIKNTANSANSSKK